MNFYLPENLIKTSSSDFNTELERLIYLNKPSFKPFKQDYIKYIIHSLSNRRLYNKDLMYEDFVPLNASVLQKMIGKSYKEYLKYMINDLEILETDAHYINNVKSIGYKIVDKYDTKLIPIKVSTATWSLYKKLKVAKNDRLKSVQGLSYLSKWFNPKLEIDIDAAKNYIEMVYSIKKNNRELWDYKIVKGKKKYKNPKQQYKHAMLAVDKLYRKEFSTMRDPNVYRYHTNLTTFPSSLRNALTYNGEKLYSIDIKNCQPYIAIVLLSQYFWLGKNKRNKSFSFGFSEVNTSQQTVYDSLYTNNTNISININKINIHTSDSYIMIGEIPEALVNKDFLKFIKLVVTGQLYEYLADEFYKQLGIRIKNRKEIKRAVFQVLFTNNGYMSKEKKVFKKAFPDVYKIFTMIKKHDKSLLPRLLQSIESYLIIDVIAKRISKEFPNAPIYSIHDSLATTKEYVKDVERIMLEELSSAIGHTPKLKIENWDKVEMEKELVKLIQKANDKGIHILKDSELNKDTEDQSGVA